MSEIQIERDGYGDRNREDIETEVDTEMGTQTDIEDEKYNKRFIIYISREGLHF